MLEYAERVHALATVVYDEERAAGTAHVDAMAMASAACVEVATRITLACCEMSRDDFVKAVGEHYDLVHADVERRRRGVAN